MFTIPDNSDINWDNSKFNNQKSGRGGCW